MAESHLPPPILVADAAGLERLAADLAGEPALGVDTESNSLYAYRERVCLIQFSSRARDYIVDPLALDDLNPLGPLLANPAQLKIFHAAEYDVICLKRDFGFAFANLFDTMVAARTLGWPQLGLGALLETHFSVRLNKRFQRANWGERPLSPELLDYARLDTRYLVPLHARLAAELAAAGRGLEAQEEFERLERLNSGPNNGVSPHAFWRVNGARDLAPAEAAVLRELHHYRERQAERADRPPFKIMSDETLVEVARAAPRGLGGLQGLRGMTPQQIRRHGAQLLAAVRRGQAAAPVHPPHLEREPDEVRDRFELLHQWRKQKAKARGVESDVIVSRDALWELARRNPRTPEALAALEHLGPWRRAEYGDELLHVLTGQAWK
ncbi:MAG: HRDC domain-containing protein [Anaerolineales bacterium]|nr:HRDC domain-containing protein [Anaerolineales bacterium]